MQFTKHLTGVACFILAATLLLCSCSAPSSGSSSAVPSSVAPSSSLPTTSTPNTAEAIQSTAVLPDEMRAVWISFLEWDAMDIATEDEMRATLTPIFDNCVSTGLNTVIVHARAFSDALYKSDLFPWSHLLTGTQGQDPGYDPLAVMIDEAHSRGLRLEVFINPFRAHHRMYRDLPLAQNNPAAQNPNWVKEGSDGSLWYDPGLPEVRSLVVQGVQEIAQNYNVDGIQFDDYFYTGAKEEAFDADSYAQYGGGLPLAQWRQQNITQMVGEVYAAIKQANPAIAFGISPAGNIDNNYSQEYSDIKLWMSTPGYIDYMIPQLYWGFDFTLSNGSDRFAFGNITQEWAALPRAQEVTLYAGLAAYALQESADQPEWQTGANLAKQVEYLRTVEGFSGFALFRYDSLFNNGTVETQEKEALTALLHSAQ